MTPPANVTETQMTTKEFSERCGKPLATIQKWLRSGKLNGTKIGNRWYIAPTELSRLTATHSDSAAPTESAMPRKGQPTAATVSKAKTYSVSEFSALTYLTEVGVERWLQSGRLLGERTREGEWRIKAVSLELPHLRHLVRP